MCVWPSDVFEMIRTAVSWRFSCFSHSYLSISSLMSSWMASSLHTKLGFILNLHRSVLILLILSSAFHNMNQTTEPEKVPVSSLHCRSSSGFSPHSGLFLQITTSHTFSWRYQIISHTLSETKPSHNRMLDLSVTPPPPTHTLLRSHLYPTDFFIFTPHEEHELSSLQFIKNRCGAQLLSILTLTLSVFSCMMSFYKLSLAFMFHHIKKIFPSSVHIFDP